jgi:hypothetical protein
VESKPDGVFHLLVFHLLVFQLLFVTEPEDSAEQLCAA